MIRRNVTESVACGLMAGVASLVLGTPKHHTAISRHGKIAAQSDDRLVFLLLTVSSTVLLKLRTFSVFSPLTPSLLGPFLFS